MKEEDSAKKIAIILCAIIVILILFVVSFFFYICNNYDAKDTNIKVVDLNNEEGEIITVDNIGKNETQKNLISADILDENEENVYTVKPPSQIYVDKTVDYNTTGNKYYYNLLDKHSKSIYKILEKQKDNMKTGNAIINLPDDLSEFLETEELKNSIKEILTIALTAFEYDNPDMFYIDISKMVLYYETDSLGNSTFYLKNNQIYNNYFIDGIDSEQMVCNYIKEIDLVVDEIQNEINEKNLSTDYEKILYIHDWIVNNSMYDESLNTTNRDNIYGIFKENEATCGGYAKAFKYLMDKLGINCIIVQGKAISNEQSEYHAWNYVEINEKWYGVDCTWDDPIIIGDKRQELHYTYFLKGQNVFGETHEPFKKFYETNVKLNYPELEIENYNN